MKRYMQSSYKFLSFIFFLVVWEGVAYIVDNSLLFPRILEVLEALKNLVFNENFLFILWHTFSRFLLSVFISIIGSVFLGVLSYRYSIFQIFLTPFTIFLRAVPTIAIIILVLIWSSTERVPIIVGMLILFPILYEGILGALNKIDGNLIKMSRVFKVSRSRVIKNIYIPSVYYTLSSNIPSYLGLTFKVIIAGEVLSQENLSIGGEIFLNKIYLESSTIFAWIIVIILLNYLLEESLKLINLKLCRWQKC
ncbi:ABC transporter permease subunit [uncultured Fusobacterium sp.]|uniref:ABC transporter permease n=1 Tax=uncultured Fusobacterium sp. TaxID=159267 RepID=UPI0025DE5F7B|nr:ABC transporter permease subunit [uncultured Fusobacterium sp.]